MMNLEAFWPINPAQKKKKKKRERERESTSGSRPQALPGCGHPGSHAADLRHACQATPAWLGLMFDRL